MLRVEFPRPRAFGVISEHLYTTVKCMLISILLLIIITSIQTAQPPRSPESNIYWIWINTNNICNNYHYMVIEFSMFQQWRCLRTVRIHWVTCLYFENRDNNTELLILLFPPHQRTFLYPTPALCSVSSNSSIIR